MASVRPVDLRGLCAAHLRCYDARSTRSWEREACLLVRAPDRLFAPGLPIELGEFLRHFVLLFRLSIQERDALA
jgi:hypothetical protein